MTAFCETPAMKLRRAYLNMHRTFDALFRRQGVTADQFALLSVLAEEEGITQQELARKLASDSNTVAAMIALLEGRGILRREACNGDGRAKAVFLTAGGRRLLARLKSGSAPLHRMLAECFGGEVEQHSTIEVLERVASMMLSAREGTSPVRQAGRPPRKVQRPASRKASA
jgi:DNA-binding MarR family transcriptional regulator